MEKKKSVSYDTDVTALQFEAYQNMFAYFNAELFGGELPNVILNFSRKGKNTGGFFAPKRWVQGESEVHEISLNPDHWKKGTEYLVSILVHEMAHLWQQEFGKVPRGGYHNKQWGDKMKEIGLYPSNTGKEGGKETGQQMSHYIEIGGNFERSLKAMPKEYVLPFDFAVIPPKMVKSKTKTKYICPSCDAKVWGKPDMDVKCLSCDEEFQPE